MKVFKCEQRFNSKTGKPCGTEVVNVGWLCDYCGTFHLLDEELQPEVTYNVNEVGGSEPQFHEFRVEGFPQIDVYDLFNNHPEFLYCVDWDTMTFCEMEMVESCVTENKRRRKSGIRTCQLLCHMMYETRVRMLAKVLAEKTYTLEELKLK